MRLLFLSLPALLFACNGDKTAVDDTGASEDDSGGSGSGSGASVEVTDQEAFGEGLAATWTGSDTVSLYRIGEAGALTTVAESAVLSQSLHIYNGPVSCEDLAAALQAWADASTALLASDGEAATRCAAITTFVNALATAPSATSDNRLFLDMCFGEGCVNPLVPGTYAFGQDETTRDRISGSIIYEENAPDYSSKVAAAWDETSCTFDSESIPRATRVQIGEGSLIFDSVEDDVGTSGSLDATLIQVGAEGEEPTQIGAVTATFDAEWCEMPDVLALVLTGA